jgi:hypothetical protein
MEIVALTCDYVLAEKLAISMSEMSQGLIGVLNLTSGLVTVP